MDLQSIQTKLIQTVNSLGQSDGNVQVDWAGSPLPLGQVAAPQPGVEFSTAVDTLQWRSAHPAQTNSAAAVGPEVYTKRLQAMATKINHLSAEQERTIAEMQTIQAYLNQLPPQGEGSLPVVDLRQATLATAQADPQGNILLSYRTVNPALPPRPFSQGRPVVSPMQLADQLRATYGSPGSRGRGWQALVAEALTLGQEPIQLVSQIGRGVWQMTHEVTRRLLPSSEAIAAAPHLAPGSRRALPSLSLADSALWFGGGVIGRLALNLLLTAFPGLWSVAVAAMTAMTAYALYRATLSPRLAFGPALRVFLLVVGLVIGGQI